MLWQIFSGFHLLTLPLLAKIPGVVSDTHSKTLFSASIQLEVDSFERLISADTFQPFSFPVIGFDLDVINLSLHPRYSISKSSSFISGKFILSTFVESFNNYSYFLGDKSKPGPNSNAGYERYYEDSYKNLTFANFTPVWYRRETWEVATKACAVSPVVLVAVLGNLAVIRIILKARLTRNHVNMFILNMSIADLLCALIFPWIILCQDLYQSWMLGAAICKTEGFILLTLMLTSVLSLTVISYDRLKAVFFPFNKRINRKTAKRIIWVIWIFSAACSSPLIFWRSYNVRIWSDFEEKWCKEDFQVLENYWLVVLILLVWVPLSILTISYTTIVYKLDTLELRQKDHPAQVKLKSKVVRMLFAVVIVFATCWLPFSVLIIIRNSKKETTTVWPGLRHFFFVSHYLMFVNSAVNPIIYGLMNDNLKKEISLAVPACMRKKHKQEISTVYNQNEGKKSGKTNEMRNRAFSSKEDEDSPASIVSLQRKASALKDLGLNPEDLVVPKPRSLVFAD